MDASEISAFFTPGQKMIIGTHCFEADAIVAFARKFDPQRFHVDAEAARDSVFGGLCASGWHTTAIWMKCNVAHINRVRAAFLASGKPAPEFGPSPGIRDLRWFQPVFAGDTITYARTVKRIRGHPARPGWSTLTTEAEAWNQDNKPVMSFQSSVLVWLPVQENTTD